jgi:peptidoglycan hydrolase-like protein with peptidoglycan-binding domain
VARKKAPKVKWPLEDGRYLSTRTISPRSVSSGPAVLTLRTALGLSAGVYDESVRQAVVGAQEAAGRPATGVVDEQEWDALLNPTPAPRRRRSAASAGGVDGADEADGPTGELDPPQGPQ